MTSGVSPNPPTFLELLMALDLGELASHYAHRTSYKHPIGALTYEGEAYVAEQEQQTDVEMPEASRQQSVSGPAPPTPPMSAQDQIASDAELCRRLCLNLRPRSQRFKAAAKHVPMDDNTADEMEWDTEYALHDALRGVEVPEDDDDDEDY